MKSPINDDGDEYVPSGLLNNNQNSLRKDIKVHQISEFYNLQKQGKADNEKVSDEIIVDLSKSGPSDASVAKSHDSASTIQAAQASHRFALNTLQWPMSYSNSRQIGFGEPRPAPSGYFRPSLPVHHFQRLPHQSELYGSRMIPQIVPQKIIHHFSQPPLAMLPRTIPPRHMMFPQHQQQNFLMRPTPNIAQMRVFPSHVHHPYVPMVNHFFVTQDRGPSGLNSVPPNPSFHAPQQPSTSEQPSNTIAAVPQDARRNFQDIPKPRIENPEPEQELQPKNVPEPEPALRIQNRKKTKTEEAAEAKIERDALKAVQKAQRQAERQAERSMLEAKRKKRAHEEDGKYSNFSKDMFVIRLKDVDSFDRNNEIWRIDNHLLIQKFTGVPSIRAPARQFQSTNKLSGYDSRATWRFFIINPENVEIDNHGSEITVFNFPVISVLREAKVLAEVKDEEFRKVEQTEKVAKVRQFEARRITKSAERRKKRSEKREEILEHFSPQKLSSKSLSGKSSSNWSINDENGETCREVLSGILDAVDENNKPDDEDVENFSDLASYCGDDDDRLSLYTLDGGSDKEDYNITRSNIVLGEEEVPEVGLELTI